MKNLQLIVLKDAFHIWPEPLVQDYFAKAINLKHLGYKGKYPVGAVPVDTTEFTGNHLLVCQKTTEGLKPFMGFRSISLQKCETHFSKFPLLQIAQSSGSPLHAEAVAFHIERCKKEQLNLIYNGGWTILPSFRRDPQLNTQCKEMMMAFDYLFHHAPHTPYEVFGAGVVQYKTEKFFQSYGYDYMTYQGNELSEIPSHYLGGVLIKFLRVQEYKPLAIHLAKQYEHLWFQRIELSEESLQEVPQKQAA
jgi:hypothetical protein